MILDDYAILYFDVVSFKYLILQQAQNNENNLVKMIGEYLNNCALNFQLICHTQKDSFYGVIKKENLDFTLVEKICHYQNDDLDMKFDLRCVIYKLPFNANDIDSVINKLEIGREYLKNQNTNKRYHIYDESIEKIYENQNDVISNLEKAISEGNIEPYFQPVFKVKSKKVNCAECVVRWQNNKE